MGKSKIEWTDATWNPWSGCTKVSPGCKNCYAERIVNSHGGDFSVVHATKQLSFPYSLNTPHMIFTCSMSDFFHPVADEWRNLAWDVIKQTPRHTYQILTKRPERIADHLPIDWPYPNVWLGTSVEMNMYSSRIDSLVENSATVHFVSYEPLLEDITEIPNAWDIEWIITGGESDYHNPRPAQPHWFTNLRDIAEELGIAFLHKQNGGKTRCSCHGAWGCRLLEDQLYDGFPRVN